MLRSILQLRAGGVRGFSGSLSPIEHPDVPSSDHSRNLGTGHSWAVASCPESQPLPSCIASQDLRFLIFEGN